MKFKKIIIIIAIATTLLSGCGKSTPNTMQTLDKNPVQETKTKDSSRSFGNTVSNFQYPKFAAEYDEYFYYSSVESNGVFRFSKESDDYTVLNNDKGTYLNAYKDKLYYIDNSNLNLIKVDLDGVSNREVIDSLVSSILIKDDILLYSKSIPHENSDGFNSINLIKIDLKTNQKLSDKNVADRSYRFIDENRFISGSRDLFNILFIDGKMVFPKDNTGYMLNVIGSTKNHVLCSATDFDDNRSFLLIDNNGDISEINIPFNSNYIVADNKVFYSNFAGFGYVDIETKENKKLHNHSMNESKTLFEFDGIIYAYSVTSLDAVYDLDKETVLEKYASEPEKIDEVEISRNLIKNDDKSNITTSELNGFNLNYIERLTSQECISLAKSWNIDLTGNCYSFALSGEYMKNQYIVEFETQKVYCIPNQGMMPAYLLDDNKKIKKFEYIIN